MKFENVWASKTSLTETELIEPDDGLASPVNMLRVVVFPAPFGPKNPKISPFSIEKSTPLTALNPSYSLTRFLTSNMLKVNPPEIIYWYERCDFISPTNSIVRFMLAASVVTLLI